MTRRDAEMRRRARSNMAEMERAMDDGEDEGIEDDIMPQMMSIKPNVTNAVSGTYHRESGSGSGLFVESGLSLGYTYSGKSQWKKLWYRFRGGPLNKFKMYLYITTLIW